MAEQTCVPDLCEDDVDINVLPFSLCFISLLSFVSIRSLPHRDSGINLLFETVFSQSRLRTIECPPRWPADLILSSRRPLSPV